MNVWVPLSIAVILCSCVRPRQQADAPVPAPAEPSPASPIPTSTVSIKMDTKTRIPCQKPTAFQKTLASVQDVIELINLMPKPLTLPCFVEVLDRPLSLFATTNNFSGQPGDGKFGPRMIFFVSDSLSLGVVAAGRAKNTLELGQRMSDDYAVRGELLFPITDPLSADAPYTHALLPGTDSTLCSLCHVDEKKAGEGFPPMATQSKIRVFDSRFRVSVPALKALHEECKTITSHECDLIQALFQRDEVIDRSVP